MSDGVAASTSRPHPRRLDGSAEPGPVVLFVYNLLYWPYLFSTCALLFVPSFFLWLLTRPWDEKQRVLSWYTTGWGAHYLTRAPFAGVTVEGLERAPADAACVF